VSGPTRRHVDLRGQCRFQKTKRNRGGRNYC
jgi:hypothetical protein